MPCHDMCIKSFNRGAIKVFHYTYDDTRAILLNI